MTQPLSLKPKSKIIIDDNEYLPLSLKSKGKPKEEKEKSNSFKEQAQAFASSTPTQAALGLSQAVTSPLDLFKMYLQGEALAALDEAEEVAAKYGKPFDREKEQEKIMAGLEYLPTQSLAEQLFEEKTGISTEPKDRTSKVLRGLFEFVGLAKGKPLKTPKLEAKKLVPEQQALRETAEEFGLRKFTGVENEKPPAITPVVSPKRQEKLSKELSETTKKAVNDVISEKIPVKKMKESGVNLQDAYTAAYDATRKTASEMGDKSIDLSNVLDWIETEVKRTKGSSPSLSKQQKIYIDILENEKKNLIPYEKPRQSGKIDLITGKKVPQSTKKTTANQAINQYQNYNDNVKGIWRKPEFSGAENTVKNAYAGLNDQIIKSIEKANPQLGKDLTFANRIFHQSAKLDQVEGIISKSFKDGYSAKRLSKTLENKRERAFLQRNLGPDAVQDLERIAKYGEAAESKVFKELKNPQTVKEYLNKMTPAQLALLVGFKGHAGLAYYIPKAVLSRAQGYLFTRNGTRKDYINFLKQAAQAAPNKAALIMASKKLQKSIEEEFGSENELLDMSREE